jgi:hypothetical protein
MTVRTRPTVPAAPIETGETRENSVGCSQMVDQFNAGIAGEASQWVH